MDGWLEFGLMDDPLTGDLYSYYEFALIAPGPPELVVTDDGRFVITDSGLFVSTG